MTAWTDDSTQNEIQQEIYSALKDLADNDLSVFKYLEQAKGNGFVSQYQIERDISGFNTKSMYDLLHRGITMGILEEMHKIALKKGDFVDDGNVYLTDANETEEVYRMIPDRKDIFKSALTRISAEKTNK